jgi:5-(aminomethyl)-3-furanmethanol phosphate kinase
MSKSEDRLEQQEAIVVKLGGSLYNHVPELVTAIRSSPIPLFIVPGGGRFADAVRAAGLPDDEAHWEAITAMDTFGRHLASFGFDVTDKLSIPVKNTVFLPSHSMRYYDPLPHSWDVTSDTIAAWVAERLGLDLVVLKSVDGILVGDSLSEIISKPLVTDAVDPCFIPYVLKNRIRTTIINGTVPERVAEFLAGSQVPCTRIGTTF